MLMLSVVVKTAIFLASLGKPTKQSDIQGAYADYLRQKEFDEQFQNPAWPNGPKFPKFPKPVISPEMKQAMDSSRPVFAAFLKEIQADNLSAAYRMTSESFRERMGQEDFEILICNHPQIKQTAESWLIANSNSFGGPITVQKTMSAPDGTEITITVRQTSQGWVVDDLSITAKGK
jgi:hypothetical protein